MTQRPRKSDRENRFLQKNGVVITGGGGRASDSAVLTWEPMSL